MAGKIERGRKQERGGEGTEGRRGPRIQPLPWLRTSGTVACRSNVFNRLATTALWTTSRVVWF